MSIVGKTAQRSTTSKSLASQIPDTQARRSPRIQKPVSAVQNPDSSTFLRPLSRSVPRSKPSLYKSSSCQNIKSSRSNSQSSLDSCGSTKGSKSRKPPDRKPASTVALPSAVLRESNSSNPGVSANTVNGDRIYVNSDLLSRVEKEKKQYEARISELTQLTESRKLEIERLSMELRNLREAKERAEALVQRHHNLKRKISDTDLEEDSLSCPSCLRSLPEGSVATITTSTSDQQSLASGLSSLFTDEATAKPPSVTNLENRIHEMEEANYTTTEELQATMGELCEMQRILDETQEENRNLAFERAILLESLCTQTAKLEHCRLQIEQLKHLLVTDPGPRGTREAHFVELYASVEEEKQILLTQNNDLAQRCESLDAECRQLSEKVESLTREMEHLRGTEITSAPAGDVPMPNIQVESGASAQVENLMQQVAEWREKFELELADHEREVTELRLYERDLLKTVQVADGIRMESEAEVARATMETRELRDRVTVVLFVL